MRTPWGDIAVADAHVHFFSDRFFRLLAAQNPELEQTQPAAAIAQRVGWLAPPADPAELAAQWVSEFDRHGVARAAIIASMPGDEESVASAVVRFPDRFYGYFMLNPLAADAAERASRALDDSRLQGICLFPAMHRYAIEDDRLAPVFDLAAARPGTVVFVHCGVLTVGVRKKLGLPSPFDMRFSNPIHLHPVALRYPQVPFVVPHFGAGYFREALMLCDLCPNVFLDTSSTNAWMRYEGLDLAAVFRRALTVAGPTRLLFGTDSSFFPRGWHAAVFEQQATALSQLGLSAADAAAVFGGNLDRILRRNATRS